MKKDKKEVLNSLLFDKDPYDTKELYNSLDIGIDSYVVPTREENSDLLLKNKITKINNTLSNYNFKVKLPPFSLSQSYISSALDIITFLFSKIQEETSLKTNIILKQQQVDNMLEDRDKKIKKLNSEIADLRKQLNEVITKNELEMEKVYKKKTTSSGELVEIKLKLKKMTNMNNLLKNEIAKKEQEMNKFQDKVKKMKSIDTSKSLNSDFEVSRCVNYHKSDVTSRKRLLTLHEVLRKEREDENLREMYVQNQTLFDLLKKVNAFFFVYFSKYNLNKTNDLNYLKSEVFSTHLVGEHLGVFEEKFSENFKDFQALVKELTDKGKVFELKNKLYVLEKSQQNRKDKSSYSPTRELDNISEFASRGKLNSPKRSVGSPTKSIKNSPRSHSGSPKRNEKATGDAQDYDNNGEHRESLNYSPRLSRFLNSPNKNQDILGHFKKWSVSVNQADHFYNDKLNFFDKLDVSIKYNYVYDENTVIKVTDSNHKTEEI